MRRRHGARGGLIEAHERVAALDLIAVVQDHRVDALPVDQRAVARAEVAHAIAPVLGVQREVAARDRDVGEHQVLVRAASDADLRQDELVGLAAVGAPDDVQDGRCHRSEFITCYKRSAMRVAYPPSPNVAAPLPRPGKILGVGRNYREHAAELGSTRCPTEPLLFMKPTTAILASGQPIVRPRGSWRVDFEGELGVVIGKRAAASSAPTRSPTSPATPSSTT